MSDFKHYSLDELKSAVETAICWSDVCRTVNVSVCTYNFNRMKKLCPNCHSQTPTYRRRKE